MIYKLKDLVNINYGKDHKKISNGNIPVYGTGGLMRYVDKYIYDGNSVLIPRKGSLNNVKFVQGKFWTVDTMFWTKINSEIVLPKYLYYCISKINLAALNVGSAVPSLTVKILNELQFNIPNIDEQQKIINKIAPIEAKIILNNQINDNLAKLKTEIFNNMFDSKLKYHLNGKLQDITKITTGKRPRVKSNIRKSNNKYPIIGASKIMGYTSEYLYNDSIITTGRVGTHGIVQRFREPVWVSDNSFVFITEHEDYLYEILSHRINYDAINTGSTQPLITQTNLKNIDIYVPTKKQFQNFENKTFFITTQQFIFKQQNNLLRLIKSQMLKKFF